MTYSNSKGCAELVTAAYRASYFPPAAWARHGIALASARAGNAIGGGDWTADQLIPDLVRAFAAGQACAIRSPDAVRPWRGRAAPSVDAALDLVGISHLGDAKPSELPAGHQKLVGIARGLASDGRVVFLDEPAAGLDHSESDVLSSHLRRVVDAGITVLLVEHDMRLVFAVSDRVAVLDQGRLIAEGSPDDVRQNPAVIAAYLGTTVAVETPEEALR